MGLALVSDCNLLMAIVVVLDSRYKMILIDLSFNQIYDENDARSYVCRVREALYELYDEYVLTSQIFHRAKNSSNIPQELDFSHATSSSHDSRKKKGKSITSGLSRFDHYLNSVEIVAPVKSELDIYLE